MRAVTTEYFAVSIGSVHLKLVETEIVSTFPFFSVSVCLGTGGILKVLQSTSDHGNLNAREIFTPPRRGRVAWVFMSCTPH